jgi:hypothetical protein
MNPCQSVQLLGNINKANYKSRYGTREIRYTQFRFVLRKGKAGRSVETSSNIVMTISANITLHCLGGQTLALHDVLQRQKTFRDLP